MEDLKIKKRRSNLKVKRSSNVIIDSSVAPRIPIPEWVILEPEGEKHEGEIINWNSKKISLFLLNKQKKDGVFIRPEILIEKFRKEEEKFVPLNASVLDYLLDHQDLIPESWKKNKPSVMFWGTIYLAPNNQKMIRFMQFAESLNQFIDGWSWLESGFSKDEPAVIIAK